MIKLFRELNNQESKAHMHIESVLENANQLIEDGKLEEAKIKIILAMGLIGAEYKKIEKKIRCR